MAVEYTTNGNPDGALIATTAADKVGFFGATPVAQQTLVTLSTGATLATVTASVQAILVRLKNLGLVASS